MLTLGRIYTYGWGVEEDRLRGFELYKEAADLGNTEAMNKVAFCYMVGIGVNKDAIKAVNWYMKAARLGDKDAQKKLRKLNKTQ